MSKDEENPGAFKLTLPSDKEVLLTCTFDAPRELVFTAYTDKDLRAQWSGPKGYTNTVEKMDLRPGGVWRIVQRDPQGKTFTFHGRYREVTPPERIVDTFEYEGMPGHVLVETITFQEHDGRTNLSDRATYQSKEDRDGMLNSGMEKGAAESMERLAALLEKIQIHAGA